MQPIRNGFCFKDIEISATPQNSVATVSALKTTAISHPTEASQTPTFQVTVSQFSQTATPGHSGEGGRTPHRLPGMTELSSPTLLTEPQTGNVFSTDLIPAPDLKATCRIFSQVE